MLGNGPHMVESPWKKAEGIKKELVGRSSLMRIWLHEMLQIVV